MFRFFIHRRKSMFEICTITVSLQWFFFSLSFFASSDSYTICARFFLSTHYFVTWFETNASVLSRTSCVRWFIWCERERQRACIYISIYIYIYTYDAYYILHIYLLTYSWWMSVCVCVYNVYTWMKMYICTIYTFLNVTLDMGVKCMRVLLAP